jgi:hypothetical protein
VDHPGHKESSTRQGQSKQNMSAANSNNKRDSKLRISTWAKDNINTILRDSHTVIRIQIKRKILIQGINTSMKDWVELEIRCLLFKVAFQGNNIKHNLLQLTV